MESEKDLKMIINLDPNPSLPPVERYLQSRLLSLIDELGTIGKHLVFLDEYSTGLSSFDVLCRMWSDAQTIAFGQVIKEFKWE